MLNLSIIVTVEFDNEFDESDNESDNEFDNEINGFIEIKITNKHNNILFEQMIYSLDTIEQLKQFINNDAIIDFGQSNAGSAALKFDKNIFSCAISTGFNNIIPTNMESRFYLNEIELKQFKKEFYKLNSVYYARKIYNWYKYNKKNKILWKIAEYYTKIKYSPENILKYIDLN